MGRMWLELGRMLCQSTLSSQATWNCCCLQVLKPLLLTSAQPVVNPLAGQFKQRFGLTVEPEYRGDLELFNEFRFRVTSNTSSATHMFSYTSASEPRMPDLSTSVVTVLE
jgi:hypothetical protein